MCADPSSGYWLAVLPWLQLASEVRLDELRFLSVDTAHPDKAVAALERISRDCAQVLRSFRLSDQCSINRCTLLVPDGWDPCVPPDAAVQARFGRAKNLLMLAAFAANEYGYYNSRNANSSMFQLFIATFTSPPGYLSLLDRRHDRTSVAVGAKWGDPLFYVPEECNPPGPVPVSVDEALARALGSLADSHPLAQNIRLALPFFGWANTLASASSWEMEIIALVAAFENLLHEGKEAGVAKVVQQLLAPFGSVPVRDARRTRPKIKAGAAQLEEPVRRAWIRELYDVRNSLAHPKPRAVEELAWLPHEHLAMGAFLFPLLAKLLLAQCDLYGLTWDDKAACDAVDVLLSKTPWFNWGEVEHSECRWDAATTWAATLEQARRTRREKEAEKIAKRMSRGEV